MLNCCYGCGEYRADKIINGAGERPVAVCPECNHEHLFLMLPLLIVTGASGVGKSTILQRLIGTVSEAVLLDCDILWFGDDHAADHFEVVLRVSKNVSQAGRPVVLFGSGIGVPDNLESCVERRYFSRLHYLALTCDPKVQAERLRARPPWRKSHHAEFAAVQVDFNKWFLGTAGSGDPPHPLLDTTDAPVEQTAVDVADWIRRTLGSTTA